jgi:hypothetical protein
MSSLAMFAVPKIDWPLKSVAIFGCDCSRWGLPPTNGALRLPHRNSANAEPGSSDMSL